MMPGFVNCHTDVVPYLTAGLKAERYQHVHGPIINSQRDQRSQPLNLIANDKSALQLFNSFIVRSLLQYY